MFGLPCIPIHCHEWENPTKSSRVTKSRMKVIVVLPHEWQKVVIYANAYIILFLTRYFMYGTHLPVKSNQRSFISPLSPRTFCSDFVTSSQLICDVTRTRGNGIVTSHSLVVLARANWHKVDLHWWITAVNDDFLVFTTERVRNQTGLLELKWRNLVIRE